MGVGKILLGIILIIIGLWTILPDPYGMGWYTYLGIVVLGILPAILVFVGIILVWIESEEMKISKPRRKR